MTGMNLPLKIWNRSNYKRKLVAMLQGELLKPYLDPIDVPVEIFVGPTGKLAIHSKACTKLESLEWVETLIARHGDKAFSCPDIRNYISSIEEAICFMAEKDRLIFAGFYTPSNSYMIVTDLGLTTIHAVLKDSGNPFNHGS